MRAVHDANVFAARGHEGAQALLCRNRRRVDTRYVFLRRDDNDVTLCGGAEKYVNLGVGNWVSQGSVFALRVSRKVEVHVLADAIAEVVADVPYLI